MCLFWILINKLDLNQETRFTIIWIPKESFIDFQIKHSIEFFLLLLHIFFLKNMLRKSYEKKLSVVLKGEGKTTYTFSVSVNAFSVEFPLACYQQAGRVWYISGALRRTYMLFYPAPRSECGKKSFIKFGADFRIVFFTDTPCCGNSFFIPLFECIFHNIMRTDFPAKF